MMLRAQRRLGALGVAVFALLAATSFASVAQADCASYCNTITSNCTGANAQFGGADPNAQCLAVCAHFPAGTSGDTFGLSLACLEGSVAQTATDPDTACSEYGPAAKGCTPNCNAYCALSPSICAGPDEVYSDPIACSEDCFAYFGANEPWTAEEADTTDSFRCRMYRLLAAAPSSRTLASFRGWSPTSPGVGRSCSPRTPCSGSSSSSCGGQRNRHVLVTIAVQVGCRDAGRLVCRPCQRGLGELEVLHEQHAELGVWNHFELSGLVSAELGDSFDLTRMLNHGCMPRIYDATRPTPLLRVYVADYLKAEIAAEGLIRQLGPFDDFLRQAALADSEQVNSANIARDCGVSRPTVRAYYGILEDTLLGRFLPVYTRRAKRRITKAPKFYFADVGVVNQLAKRRGLEPGGQLYGKAMESWLHHELCAYIAYAERDADLSYWRLTTGVEVDFIVNDMELAVECKASARVRPGHPKNLRELVKDQPDCRRRILVSLADTSRTTEDGIEIMPVGEFLAGLWGGALF